MDFPGGRVPFTSTLAFAGGPDVRTAPIACYRTIDSAGTDVPDASVPHPLGQQLFTRAYLRRTQLRWQLRRHVDRHDCRCAVRSAILCPFLL